jgi:hypothetical protein
MSTVLTPPPADAIPPRPSAPEPPRDRSAARVISILTIALGVAVVVVTVWGAIVPTVRAATARSGVQTVAVPANVSALDIDVDAADLDIRFDDVDEATLLVERFGGDDWTLESDGGVLRVHTPRDRWWSWFGSSNGDATLTLPSSLSGVDAVIGLDAGSVVADGDFGALELDLGAGDAGLRGSATALTLDLSAGRADVDLVDVADAVFEVDAGEIAGSFGGTAPDSIRITANAGSVDVALPDAEYDVTSQVAAGSFDNGLTVSSSSPRTVAVEVSAGSVRLR